MSSVSNHEKAVIGANYHYLLDSDTYNCEYKWSAYQDRTNYDWDKVVEFFKETKGCFGGSGEVKSFRKLHSDNSSTDKSVIINGIRYKSCLCNLKNSSTMYFIDLYDKYQKFGLLPFSGTITEQPAKIMEIFNVLESVKIEYTYKKQKENKG